MVTNAPSTAPSPVPAASPAAGPVAARLRRSIKVYPRSNLLYWWPVWFYGYVCAAFTYAEGFGVTQFVTVSGRPVLFHPSSALGWSFILVILLVLFLTNVRARGVYSIVLLAVIALLALLLPNVPGFGLLGDILPMMRVHMNLAFYMIFSSLILLLWLFSVLVIDRMTWVRFSTGQVAEEHLLAQAVAHVYPSEGLIVRRLPDDLFRHKLLGLRWIGQGTGDFLIRPAHGESFELHNVWRANTKQAIIERLIATKMTDHL